MNAANDCGTSVVTHACRAHRKHSTHVDTGDTASLVSRKFVARGSFTALLLLRVMAPNFEAFTAKVTVPQDSLLE